MVDLVQERLSENRSNKTPYLDLSGLGIALLPLEIGSFTWLEGINISDNPIRDISVISHLKNLDRFYCHHTKITDLEPLQGLEALKKIHCSNSPIFDLQSLSGLKNLQEINCSGTLVLDLLPLSNLPNMRVLNCCYNQIKDFEPIKYLRGLQELDCHFTQLDDFTALSSLFKLERLDCSGNEKVKDFKPLSRLLYLTSLNCSNTLINDLSPLSNLKNLEVLDCEFTQVADMTPLSSLLNLQKLNIQFSSVKELMPLATLPRLSSFNAEGCLIEDCPVDVYQSGNGAELRAFFERKEAEKKARKPAKTKTQTDDRTQDVKLILLGNSSAGKTNLLHYLKTGEYLGDRNSTHGLEVHRWLPDKERFPLLANIAVSIWDFGGQEYYHEAYRIFMSNNAAYLLLWDVGTNCNGRRPTQLKSGEKEEELEHFELSYWLETVRYYGGEFDRSPLLVAQNKIDLRGKQRISQDLHRQYNINESFHFSLQNGCDTNGQSRDKELLLHFERELEYALKTMVDPTPLPPTWQRIRNSILELQAGRNKRRNPFSKRLLNDGDGSLSLEEFEDACHELLGKPLFESERGSILPNILNRGGVLVYYRDSERLKNRVFLEPAALAKSVYQVLKTEVLDLKGEFKLTDIFDKKDDKNFQNVFIEVTKSMGLVFSHPSNLGAFIAPQYLPADHPIEDLYKIASHGAWDSAYCVKIPLFYYKKLLNGLVLHYASQGNAAKYFWKHGIFFLKNNLRVLLKGLYPEEDQHEGILLVGVEMGDGHISVMKEIFDQIRVVLSRREENKSQQDSSTSTIGNPEPLPSLDPAVVGQSEKLAESTLKAVMPNWLEVGRDSKFFTKYNELAAAAAAGEIKLIGKNQSGEQKQLLIRDFEPLLELKLKKAKRVFVSYSHNNTPWLGRLRAHLSGLRRSNEIEEWTDKEILPGDLWDKSIKDQLAAADVFILLLSADFIASNYIWDIELRTAIEGYKTMNKQVIPILVEPLDLGGLPGVDADGTKIQGFEIVPKDNDGHLLAVSLWPSHEKALATVAERIRLAVVGK